MRLWKKICIAAGAAMVSIALVAGCGGTSTKSSTSAGSSAASAQSTTSPLAGKHFRVGMSPTYKYFETVKLNNDGSTGYEGLDVDIMDYMAKDMGFTWEVVPSTFDGMIADLQGGGVNMDMLISGMVNTPKRSEVIDFTTKPQYNYIENGGQNASTRHSNRKLKRNSLTKSHIGTT